MPSNHLARRFLGSLAALDYLGFGLPAGTPSWGELLQQAQGARGAWWLVLWPSFALFLVMLLGVFVGEGLRDTLQALVTRQLNQIGAGQSHQYQRGVDGAESMAQRR